MRVIELRNQCNEQCGYDKYKSFAIDPKDEPVTDEGVHTFVQFQKFKPHRHETTMTTRVVASVEALV